MKNFYQISILLCFCVFLHVRSDYPPIISCLLPIYSPQFAELCKIPGTLTALNTLGLVNASQYIGMTADSVCDGDCRCVMGATARGGRCGPRPSDGVVFCLCDYGTTPRDSISPPCDPEFPIITNGLCGPSSPTQPALDNLCNSDCQCSHGYGNTQNHHCTTANGQTGNNNITYCVCENATNLV